MKKKVLSLLAFLPAFTTVMAQQTAEVPDVCAFVNPIIGTNGMGHTFPGACAPFGLVQLSPDTDTIPHNIDGTYQRNAYEYCADLPELSGTWMLSFLLARPGYVLFPSARISEKRDLPGFAFGGFYFDE